MTFLYQMVDFCWVYGSCPSAFYRAFSCNIFFCFFFCLVFCFLNKHCFRVLCWLYNRHLCRQACALINAHWIGLNWIGLLLRCVILENSRVGKQHTRSWLLLLLLVMFFLFLISTVAVETASEFQPKCVVLMSLYSQFGTG